MHYVNEQLNIINQFYEYIEKKLNGIKNDIN